MILIEPNKSFTLCKFGGEKSPPHRLALYQAPARQFDALSPLSHMCLPKVTAAAAAMDPTPPRSPALPCLCEGGKGAKQSSSPSLKRQLNERKRTCPVLKYLIYSTCS